MLRVSGLSVSYGAIKALHDVSFDVPEGTVLGILGPNGAGKTTLLSSLAGLLPVTSGTALLNGEQIQNRPAHQIVRRGISLVPQQRELFPEMTVQENLELGAKGAASRSLSIRYNNVLRLFPRLDERRAQLAGTLSGGERAMLATGRALMACPKVLLLDEPTSGLSPLIVQQLRDALRQLRAAGQTMVLVEQNVSMLLSLADRIVVIREGRVVRNGDVLTINRDSLFKLFVN